MEKQLCCHALLEMLREETDEDHVMKTMNILGRLELDADMQIGRQKLYSAIRQLRDLGEDIVYDKHEKGYYLASRPLTKGEVFMLCYAIHASNFITQDQSKILIDHLLWHLNKYDRKEYYDAVFKPNPKKMDNEELMYNIEKALEAIRCGKKMSFDYMHYNREKEFEICNHSPVVIEPRYICYENGRPYLVVQGGIMPGYMHYRLDRICNARVTEEKCTIPYEQVDAYDYSSNKLFMFAGKMTRVTIRCKKRILDAMIDIFGRDIKLTDLDDDHYQFSVTVSENGIVFLAQQYMDAVTIIEPQEIVDKIKNSIMNALKEYGV